MNCHVIQKKYEAHINEPKHASSVPQLTNLLTKPLGRFYVQFTCNKLTMYNVYAPA